jgi:excisionase family DNA binding protein
VNNTGKKRRHRRRPPTAASLYHSPDEFAERARIGRATVWRMMKQGRLRYARFGRARRIPVTEYQRLTSDA